MRKEFKKLTFGVVFIGTFFSFLINSEKSEISWEVCRMAPVMGSCRQFKVRWFYNHTDLQCEQFWYGGCDGNQNNFETKEECQNHCTPDSKGTENIVITEDDAKTKQGFTFSRTLEACSLSSDPGPATNWVIKWYYNVTEERCDRFWYGGQGGNDNRYATEEQCNQTCAQHSEDVCKQPLVVGLCSEHQTRWYYNHGKKECLQFYYSGCGGNRNSFMSQSLCERECLARTKVFGNVEKACQQERFGCCPDGTTTALGNNHEGCPRVCQSTHYGCCDDEVTIARGPNQEGCEVIEISSGDGFPCDQTKFGCCTDGRTAASGPNARGCGNVQVVAKTLSFTGVNIVPEATKDVTAVHIAVPTGKGMCAQPPDVGPCKAAMLRFFYNPDTKRCQEFIYGGCSGNRNNFESLEDCQRYCHATVDVNVVVKKHGSACEKTPEKGPCDRAITKYYYDVNKMKCHTFTYGGCLGNHNNFETEAKCLSYCGLRHSGSRSGDCALPKEVGNCHAKILRVYYDPAQGRCLQFFYGGCQGNSNNFPDEQSCLSKCQTGRAEQFAKSPVLPVAVQANPSKVEDVCSLDLQMPCPRGQTGPHWYYEHLTGECMEVPNRECNNNRNNFRSKEECESYCNRESVCRPLTYDTDIRCRADLKHWTYNRTTDTCDLFVYGGCGGSANNFQFEAACNRKCRLREIAKVTTEPKSPAEVCALPEEIGNCLVYILRWRYDSLTGKCVQFTYGGCGGNRNNFKTIEECESFCSRDVVCQAEDVMDISCFASFPRWRYDRKSKVCELFTYRGCGGNANNFNSSEACMGKCMSKTEKLKVVDNSRVSSWRDICQLQADVGPCDQNIKKWHYNSITQDCEEFTYGGCVGNHNNFESRVQCMTYCEEPRFSQQSATAVPDFDIDDSSGEMPTSEPATGVDVCALESETGPCRARIQSWYYDHVSGVCTQFVYGGCGGNGNRFSTQEDCEQQCNSRVVCMLPQRSGNCMSYLPRYFFDYGLRTCKEFIYGGCDGNANNFDSMASCKTKCDSLTKEQPRSLRFSKSGFCPPRTDGKNILGTCAPACRDDSDCGGVQKCCHQGCGLKCVTSVGEQPYKMNAPVDIEAQTVSDNVIHLEWHDPSLSSDQLIRDSRFYTVRYYSYSLGQYNYINITDLQAQVTRLQPDTIYEFNIRVNDPPYLSEWSKTVRNKTLAQDSVTVVKTSGECPILNDDDAGICLEECQNDNDCRGTQRCCNKGCGRLCLNPADYLCHLPKDPGSCASWEVRWFYNHTIQRCDRFWYGGCDEGNANNFMNEMQCQAKCLETQVTHPVPLVTKVPKPVEVARPYNCQVTTHGCCADNYTPARDDKRSNCPENQHDAEGEVVVPATPGQSVTLTCRFRNNIGWYREGKLVESDFRRRVNSSAGTLEVLAASIEDDGLYACHVLRENNQPKVYRYILQVQVPIGVMPGPDRIMVKPTNMAFLHCEVYGNPKPHVTWSKGVVPIRSGARYKTFSNGTLLILQAQEVDVDSYTCTADNGISQPVDRTIKLSLREMLIAQIENDNGRVVEGGRIKLSCEGRGYPVPTITWEKSGRPLKTGGRVNINNAGQITVINVTLEDTGTYSCIVANYEEKIETSTSVQVIPKVVPDDKCIDQTTMMKCRLIVSAKLCSYAMYSKICCYSCQRYFNGG